MGPKTIDGSRELVACAYCALPIFAPSHMQRCVLRPARVYRRRVALLYLQLIGSEAPLSEFCERSFEVPEAFSFAGRTTESSLTTPNEDVCRWCSTVAPIDAMLAHLSTCPRDPDVAQAAVAHDVLRERFTEQTLNISRIFLDRDRAPAVDMTRKHLAACRLWHQESKQPDAGTNRYAQIIQRSAQERWRTSHLAADRYAKGQLVAAPWAARPVLAMLQWLTRLHEKELGEGSPLPEDWNNGIECVDRYLRSLELD